jgi:hypothetical protein
MATTSTDEPIIDVDRDTGELISGWPRVRKSIFTILRTRLKTRLMRLWWGSDFLDLQDKPGNDEVIFKSLGAAIVAVNDYEPEFKITRLIVGGNRVAGQTDITVEGSYKFDGVPRKIKDTM